jgi:hypothetical protein
MWKFIRSTAAHCWHLIGGCFQQLWPHLRGLLEEFFFYAIPGQAPAAGAGFNGNSILELFSELAYLVGELTHMDATTE